MHPKFLANFYFISNSNSKDKGFLATYIFKTDSKHAVYLQKNFSMVHEVMDK